MVIRSGAPCLLRRKTQNDGKDDGRDQHRAADRLHDPGGGATTWGRCSPTRTGLWWNSNESGSGYNIQVQQGVLVVTMYSYAAGGDPMWYLVVGRLSNLGTGVTATGTLDHFQGGQCASCAYRSPAPMGSDGAISINFAAPNTATIQLPGGRVTEIHPELW